MQVDLITQQDLKEISKQLVQIQSNLNELKTIIHPTSPGEIMWREDILTRLKLSKGWWDNNYQRLPLKRSEGGRYYCFLNELERWIEEGNL